MTAGQVVVAGAAGPAATGGSSAAQSDFSGPTAWPAGQWARKSHHWQIGPTRAGKRLESTPSSA